MNKLITDSQALVVTETGCFASNRRFLTIAVASFSGVSLVVAMTLGAILSWSLIRPVRKVDEALGLIAEGHFDEHVEVPNRDEFGSLTNNLNRTSEHLSTLYTDLHTLNEHLQETVRREGGRARTRVATQAVPVARPRRLDPGRIAGRHPRLEPQVPHDVLLRHPRLHLSDGADGAPRSS